MSRRLFQWLQLVVVVLGFGAAIGWASTPSIPRGATQEEVVRLVGWPNGRGTAGDREVWTYRGYRVVFESGHVILVQPVEETPAKRSRHPSTSPLRKESTPSMKGTPTPVPQPRPHLTPRTSPSPTNQRPVVERLAPSTTPRPAVNPGQASDSRFPVAPAHDNAAGFPSLWTIVLGGIAILGFVVVVARRRYAHLTKQYLPPKADAGTAGETDPMPPLRRTSSRVVDAVTANELTIDRLRTLEWKRLEELAAYYFAAQGWRSECTGNGADGGVDVKLTHREVPTRRAYVQCKAWNQDIDVKLVRELFGVMAAGGVTEGWFFTTSDYTPPAREFAASTKVGLLSGSDIVREFGRLSDADRLRILEQVFRGDYRTPSCPQCGTKMVQKGTGRRFWACPRFPRCRSSPIHMRRLEPQ